MAKLLIVIVAMVALPLRGYAGVATAFCESHHGMTTSSQEIHHGVDLGAMHNDGATHGDGEAGDGAMASVCSLCAACCMNASLAADSTNTLDVAPQATARIPFQDLPVAGVAARPLDRPPLSPVR